jgi:Acyl-CoA dehydrogenases
MAWDFNESQLMFQRSCRDFSVKELRPLHKEYIGRAEVPQEGIKKMADMGILAIMQPEKYGGQSGDFVTLGIACEEISREYFELGTVPVGSKVFGDSVMLCPEEVQDELIPKFVSGEVTGALCMTEPQVGSDAAHIQMRAVREGDHYVVNGEKTSITFGAFADYGLATVVTDPTKGVRGVSLIIIPLNLPGVSRTLIPHIGAKGFGASSITFDNVHVPIRYLCGEEGDGFRPLMAMLDYLRTGLAVQCIGLALISLEETAEYVKQRQAFGQPIGKFEGVSFRLVDNFAQVEAAKLLCYKTLSLIDQGRLHEASTEAAMAKYLAPRVSFRAIWDSILFHGHLGYSEEYPLGRRLLDCLSWQIGDGTREIQEIVMVGGILGRDLVAYR